MRILITIFVLSLTMNLWGQVPTAEELVQIHQVSTTEMNGLTSPEEGSLAYNTDDNSLYFYDGSNWINTVKTSYMGVFIIQSTGTFTVSGLPFQPSQIKFSAKANVETLTLNDDNDSGQNNNNTLANAFGSGDGFARDDDGTIVQQAIYVGGHGNSINDISRFASNNHCIGIRYSNQNGDFRGFTRASIVSMNSDGFTLNVTDVADNLVVIYEAFK